MNELRNKINIAIWKACENLKNSIPGRRYVDYASVMLFIKYLSDIYNVDKEDAKAMYGNNEMMMNRFLSRKRFILNEECTFDYLYENRNDEEIGEIINKVVETITILNGEKLSDIFFNIDFNSEIVFGNKKNKNDILKRLLQDFNAIDVNLSKEEEVEKLGNTYEYLISDFAMETGKKGKEFYTPYVISKLIANIVSARENSRIYDPACGSGSLLLKVAEEAKSKKVSIYGQDINAESCNICRKNMFLHGVNDADIRCGDTLLNPLHVLEKNELMKFDIIVSNPPFSLEDWASGFEQENFSTDVEKRKSNLKIAINKDKYNRFKFGVPPRSIGDYAFVEHMLACLNDNGVMAVILPHGVLFRGAAEAEIRKNIIKENLIDAVISLPKNLFYAVSIPIVIIVFKKDRKRKDILFIDASQEYEKGRGNNGLNEENIEKIIDTYRDYKEIDRYSHIVTPKEIIDNEYNLHIKRYVNTFEEKEKVEFEEAEVNIRKLRKRIKKSR